MLFALIFLASILYKVRGLRFIFQIVRGHYIKVTSECKNSNIVKSPWFRQSALMETGEIIWQSLPLSPGSWRMAASFILCSEVLWPMESARSELFVPEIRRSMIQPHLNKCSKRPEQSISKYPKFYFSEKIW